MTRRFIAAATLCTLAIAAWLHGAQPSRAAAPQRLTVVPIAYGDGLMTAAATAGHHAYVAMGSRLVVVDLSDPEVPRVVGQSDSLARRRRADIDSGLISRVAIAGEVVYLTIAAKLVLADVSNPTQPTFIATIDMPTDGARAIASFAKVEGGRLYVGIGRQLLVYDISQRAGPQLLGNYRWPKLGFWRPDVADVIGGRAYLQVSEPGATGIRILDVADPSRIHELGVFTPTFRTNFAAMVGSTAFFARYDSDPQAARRSQLVAFSLSDPVRPVELASFDLGESYVRVTAFGSDIFVHDDVDFAGSVLHRLHRLDVSDPAHPREVAALDVPGRGDMIGSIGDRFTYFAPTWYFASGVWNGGSGDTLATLDLTGPETARMGSQLRPLTQPHAMALLGNYLYVTARDGLYVYDVSRPASPQRVAWSPGDFGSIAAAGDRLCVLNYVNYSIQVVAFDVSDPTRPRRLGAVTRESGRTLRIAGHRLYVTGGERAVETFDIAAAGPPVALGALDIGLAQRDRESWRFADIEVTGEHAYVLDGDTADLYVINVSDPTKPRQELRLPGRDGSAVVSCCWAPHLAQLAGGYLLQPNRLTGLQTIDIGAPLAPSRTLHAEITAPFVTVDRDRAYGFGGARLQVLDIAAPMQSRVIGETPLEPDVLLADGDILYGLDETTGLTVWRLGGGTLFLPMVSTKQAGK